MRRVVIAAVVALGAAGVASAQVESKPWLGVRSVALQNMPKLVCGTAPCAPATAEELANPPVSDAEAQLVYQRGVYSGVSEHCGLDWQARNHAPLMAWARDAQRKGVRELALIGAIHDLARGMARTAITRAGPCSAELKADMERQLDFRPPAP